MPREVHIGRSPSGSDTLTIETSNLKPLGPNWDRRSQGRRCDGSRWRWASTLRPVGLAVGAFAVAYAATVIADYNPRSPLMPVASKAVLAVAVAVVAAMWLARGRLRTWAPDVTAALAATFTGAILAAALHGSVYPLGGFKEDIALRIAAVAQFSETWQLLDFSYQGLPAFYPPLMSWTVGRAAALFDLAPYSAVKHASILMAFLVPLLSYLLWRRLVTPAVAAFLCVGAPSLCPGSISRTVGSRCLCSYRGGSMPCMDSVGAGCVHCRPGFTA